MCCCDCSAGIEAELINTGAADARYLGCCCTLCCILSNLLGGFGIYVRRD